MRDMIRELLTVFLKACRGTWKYGYFAPLQAAVRTVRRKGRYLQHLQGLYHLAFWKGHLYP